MIGLLLIYFIGKAFYELAFTYNKNKWLFAILGVVSYYIGTFVLGIALGVYVLISENNSILNTDDLVLNLLALPFGLLACWGFYVILRNNWKKQPVISSTDLLDDNNLNF